MLKIKYLHSNSDGNTTYIRVDDDIGIILDMGVSYKKLLEALNDELKVNIILVTHEHGDHISGLGVLGRKTQATIFIPELSYEKIKHTLKGCKIVFISGGDTIIYKNIEIKAHTVRHDSLASVAYSIIDKTSNKKYVHITDTGVITYNLKQELLSADGIFLESDYDEYLLGEYPEYDDFLKARIASNLGHLGNRQVISMLQLLKNPEWIVLGHLSTRTNSADILRTLLIENLEDSTNIDIFSLTPITKELNANINV